MSSPKPGAALPLRSFTPWTFSAAVVEMDQTANVLAIDGDMVSRRFLERGLGQRTGRASPEFALECARDAAGAFEVLRNTLCDAIICDTELPDMTGLRFLTLLRTERRYKTVPFVFLSADARSSTRIAALNAGADDCIEKPCELPVLLARLRRLIREQRALRTESQSRCYEIAGEFAVLPLPDIVTVLELSRKTGVLRVTTARATGEVVFESGTIWSASFGTLVGPSAFYRMLSEHEGRYEFVVGDVVAQVRTVFESATALILEGARLLDEGGATDSPVGPGSGLVLNPHPPAELRPQSPQALTPAPDPRTANQFLAGISDGFSLAALELFSHEELSRWTRSGLARERVQVHLVADVSIGVPALLSIAAPPSEQWVLAALSSGPKVLALSFELRGERRLDVVLVDPKDSVTVSESLGRRAAFAVVAPPQGDVVGIGAPTRALIDTFLTRTRPGMVFGVGTTALQQHLVAFPAIEAHGLVVRCLRGVLGDGRCDLRGVLVEGLRRWGALGEERRQDGTR